MNSLTAFAHRLMRLVHIASHPTYAQYLREVATDPAIVALRARAFGLLRLKEGDHIVDLGCGPGTATVEMAARVGTSGRVWGVDLDRGMIAEANKLATQRQLAQRVRHCVDDCTQLSLEDDLFDACYCERVFQHLPGTGPQRAAKEVLRILKPGGRFVVVDTVWSSIVIHTPESLGRRVAEACLRRFANPDAGAQLADWLTGAAGTDIEVESVTLPMSREGSTAALFLDAAKRALTPADLAQWSAGLDQARERELPFASIRMVMVSGIKKP